VGQRGCKSGAVREDSMLVYICVRGLRESLGAVFISLVNLILCKCAFMCNSLANFEVD